MSSIHRRELMLGGVAAACGSWAGGHAIASTRPAPSSTTTKAAPAPIRLAISDQTHKPFVLPLLELIADTAGLRWELLELPWSRALLGAELGQHLVFGLSRNPARDKIFRYSQPVFMSRGWLVVSKARPFKFERIEDLRGRTLCVSRGATYGPVFEDARQRLFRVEPGGNDLAGRARMLAAGRCDAMLATHRGSALALERRLRTLRDGDQLQVLPKPLVEEGILFAAARDSEPAALLPRLDDAIQRARAAIQALVDSDA